MSSTVARGDSSSPVLAGGHIYVVNEDGLSLMYKAGWRLRLIAKNDLREGGLAARVICASRIYLRTLRQLYCLGRTQQGGRKLEGETGR